eukprot:GHVS01007943.1.p1 GENE.GHVS01007943.1~~GHVS01007943.1.p1  ORF type:complete len:252 (+),score=60.23 GHVS01007943.1:171-926(+)
MMTSSGAVAAPPVVDGPSRTDPYYTARDDVSSAVKKAKELFQKWKTQMEKSAGAPNSYSAVLKKLEEELVGELKQIAFDLEDIKTTVQVVENNPTRFGVTQQQLHERKQFLADTQTAVQALQTAVVQKQRPQQTKQTTAATGRVDVRNRQFTDSQREQQHMLLQQQDQHLEELAMSADRLHHTAVVINEELEDQQRMLCELDEDIDREAERMNFVMKRMSRLLKTNDTRQLCLILWLVGIAVILFALVCLT